MKYKNKKELKMIIREDNAFYEKLNFKTRILFCLTKNTNYVLKKYLKYVRVSSYYALNRSIFNLFLVFYYKYKKNKLANNLNMQVEDKSLFGSITIYHPGVIINPNAIIGSGCKFHGNNCIGNNGKNDIAPRIGNNVDIGFGAIIIGDIYIADDCIIGAGAVVTKSVYESGSVIVGIPAKKVVKENN